LIERTIVEKGHVILLLKIAAAVLTVVIAEIKKTEQAD